MKDLSIENSSTSSGNIFPPIEPQGAAPGLQNIDNLPVHIASEGEKRKREEEIAEGILKKRRISIGLEEEIEAGQKTTEKGKEEEVEKPGKKSYFKETLYEGETCNGKREGKGVFKLIQDRGHVTYEGVFQKNAFISGICNISHVSGAQMRTIWKDGKEVAMTRSDPDGTIYQGEVQTEKIFHGIIVKSDQSAYVGSMSKSRHKNKLENGVWMDSLLEPSNQALIFADGQRVSEVNRLTENTLYEGECPQGDEIHYGKMTWLAEKMTYTGTFRDYVLEGVGLMEYPDSRYVGHWENGNFEGEGSLFFTHGKVARFHGQFHRGKIQGYGEMEFRSGDVYRGFWKKKKIERASGSDSENEHQVKVNGYFFYLDSKSDSASFQNKQNGEELAGSDLSD